MRSTQSIGTFDKPRSPKPSASSASAAAHNNILRIMKSVLAWRRDARCHPFSRERRSRR